MFPYYFDVHTIVSVTAFLPMLVAALTCLLYPLQGAGGR